VLVAQKSAEIELAGPNEIFKVGTVARIARMIRMPDGTLQIIVQGLERVDIGKFTRGKSYLTARISLKPEIQESDDETEAIKRNVVGYFQRLMSLAQNVREDLAAATLNLEDARQVAYVTSSIIQMEMDMKQKILELYLNEIYLGFGAYGVAAASLLYFDKSVHELSIAESAYLAALPKGPNNYNPFRRHDEAVARRNYVIDRMIEDGFVPAAEGEKAKKAPLVATARPPDTHIFAAEYFAEEVRRYLIEHYGEKKLYEGGLSVRTTLDPKLQVLARKTMINGLVNFDEAKGYRGPVARIELAGESLRRTKETHTRKA